MRWITTMIVIAVLATACSSTSENPTTTSATSTTSSAVSVPPQLADYDVQQVQVGDRMMLLAIADNPSLRRQGLRFVTDLEDLEGMLFFWRHDGDPIWMEDTLIPLDIVWFNEDGTFKDRASMDPCSQTPCPKFRPADGLDFRFAIEAPPGTLDWIDPSTVITYSD
ncbi:MAG: DUF192 domain-containing protein [Actinomycetia bacterium]|nr:DUF192 domain-containing protein [Actinomycetes bacterium]